jgi:hypothetical protein
MPAVIETKGTIGYRHPALQSADFNRASSPRSAGAVFGRFESTAHKSAAH